MSLRCPGFAVLASLVLVSLGSGQDKVARQAKPPKVTVAHPIARNVTDYVSFLGRIKAIERVDLRPRITGSIESVTFRAGQLVQKGMVLFKLDARPYEAALAQAQANLRAAEARLKSRIASYHHARRTTAPGSERTTQAEVAEAKMLVARADVEAARARLESARLQLSYANVIAPIRGRIDRPHLTPGNLARADITSLATIVSVDSLYVSFDIDQETYLHAVQDNQGRFDVRERPVTVFVGNSKHRYRAKVEFVNNHFDPNTGTLQAGAVVSNPKHDLLPGMSARVFLEMSGPHAALLVPSEAIRQRSPSHPEVLVVNDADRVVPRVITLGAAYGPYRAVKMGLSPTDRVIVKGINHLSSGMTVAPQLHDESTPGIDSHFPDIRD